MRERQFQIFLSTHELLGMCADKVQEFLGAPKPVTANTVSYCLESNCTTSLSVELLYVDGVVSKYRYRTQNACGDWIDRAHPDHSELSQYFI